MEGRVSISDRSRKDCLLIYIKIFMLMIKRSCGVCEIRVNNLISKLPEIIGVTVKA